MAGFLCRGARRDLLLLVLALLVHFGLTRILYPLGYSAGEWLPGLGGWVNDGASYVSVMSTIVELLVALATAALIARWAYRPLLLGVIVSVAVTLQHAWLGWQFASHDASFALLPYLKPLLLALALLWLALWFFLDFAGWRAKPAAASGEGR